MSPIDRPVAPYHPWLDIAVWLLVIGVGFMAVAWWRS